MECRPKGQGRGRGIYARTHTTTPQQISPDLSQYILPADNSIQEEFEKFEEHNLRKITQHHQHQNNTDKIPVLDINANYVNPMYEQISAKINQAATYAQNARKKESQNNVAFNPYKLTNVQPAQKSMGFKPQQKWKAFESGDDDDDGCQICDRSDRTVFCKTCGHNWKGRQRIKCDKHPSTVMLMDSLNCPDCHSIDLKEI